MNRNVNETETKTLIVESINSEVAPVPEERVIEEIPTAAKSFEKVTKEAASSTEEKSHNGVENAPKAVDAGAEIH